MLHLVAHKVRGELALDVADRYDQGTPFDPGPWWITSTGHRVYPFWIYPIDDLYSHHDHGSLGIRELIGTDEPPPELRDFWTESDNYSKRLRNLRAYNPRPKPTVDDLLV